MTSEQLEQSLQREYGPLIGGRDLWRALGYKTWAAFAKAVRRGTLGITVFSLPGRRGRFALTRDVADWLVASRQNSSNNADQARRHSNEPMN